MKTANIDLPLLVPHQTNKEVLINEAMLSIDQFLTNSVMSFIAIDELDTVAGDHNQRFIISDGVEKGKIACFIDSLSCWKFFMPKVGMVLFIMSEASWFTYGSSWQRVEDIAQSRVAPQFITIAGDVLLQPVFHPIYLFLNGNVHIDFKLGFNLPFTVIIKQNHEAVYEVAWQERVLWNTDAEFQVTQVSNRLDIVRFYPIPETDHLLAEIIGRNYQY